MIPFFVAQAWSPYCVDIFYWLNGCWLLPFIEVVKHALPLFGGVLALGMAVGYRLVVPVKAR